MADPSDAWTCPPCRRGEHVDTYHLLRQKLDPPICACEPCRERLSAPHVPGDYCAEHATFRCGYGFGECQGVTIDMLVAAAIAGGKTDG